MTAAARVALAAALVIAVAPARADDPSGAPDSRAESRDPDPDPDPRAAFDRATELIAAERYRDAVEALVAIADRAPDHRLAPEALFLAGELSEERLADPVRAAALLQRTLDEYPHSRRSLAAERRLGRLRGALGPGGGGAEPLARFVDLRQRFPERAQAESLALAEELLREFPDWSGAPEVALWIGEVLHRAGRHREASRRFLDLLDRWPEHEVAFAARLGAGNAALALGEHAAARAHFVALPAGDDPGLLRARAGAIERADLVRFRARAALLALALAAVAALGLALSLGLAAGSARASLSALRRVPSEVLYMAPVAALLVAAS
jgi:TolA-binding protein